MLQAYPEYVFAAAHGFKVAKAYIRRFGRRGFIAFVHNPLPSGPRPLGPEIQGAKNVCPGTSQAEGTTIFIRQDRLSPPSRPRVRRGNQCMASRRFLNTNLL